MSVRTVILAALASTVLISGAMAEDRINLTPPLFREQARTTATVRPISEMATTPRLVPAAPADPRILAEAAAR
ncbi:hypothetical protein [Methylobacterium dankookense]|uniref:Uncharacterized protein n=1 Tax=Methylobacterium dankookense TaxID=560405 RepID=A0A564G2G1_9HYPH|nr:hypothetical protein [Methylobacterium dankookense]GJD55192.1 hypothetical protein IFDJLNFL_1075 [Methylobacterium dankookense]VUF14150.1 hypothetical protein MTDSW087_03865 [Methylobacterium dankookense]